MNLQRVVLKYSLNNLESPPEAVTVTCWSSALFLEILMELAYISPGFTFSLNTTELIQLIKSTDYLEQVCWIRDENEFSEKVDIKENSTGYICSGVC